MVHLYRIMRQGESIVTQIALGYGTCELLRRTIYNDHPKDGSGELVLCRGGGACVSRDDLGGCATVH